MATQLLCRLFFNARAHTSPLSHQPTCRAHLSCLILTCVVKYTHSPRPPHWTTPKYPPQLPPSAVLPHAWSTILKEHLLKRNLQNRFMSEQACQYSPEKMLNWEYINFNELLPFCDLGSEEEQGQAQASDQFMLFPGLGKLFYYLYGSHGITTSSTCAHSSNYVKPAEVTCG